MENPVDKKRNLRWAWVALGLPLGLLVVIGIVSGLGLAGIFDTGGPSLTGEGKGEPTPTPEPNRGVVPDPNFEEALAKAKFPLGVWKTDFSLHSVPYSEIISGGPPRDGIPPLDNPRFTTPTDADQWLNGKEPVIALELDGDARAYPIQILVWHEIVNDVVGGVPVAVTFCPLCNSAIVFDRRLDGTVYDFGTSGNLRNSDLVMWDRQTESWWQQFTGEGIVGSLTGKKLSFLASSLISWEDFKAASPEGMVLSRDTGFSAVYGQNPYRGYDSTDDRPFLFDGPIDGRFPAMERVAAVTIGEADAAFPFSVLEKERVVNYTVNGQDLVVFFEPETQSAFGDPDYSIPFEREDNPFDPFDDPPQNFSAVGATGVFDPELDGIKLSFRPGGNPSGDDFVDVETGSVWNILGRAIEGPLAGQNLTPIVHANHFWFSWAVFKPDTKIYQGSSPT